MAKFFVRDRVDILLCRIEKKLATRKNEINVSLTDLKEDVPHLLMLKEEKEVFASAAQDSVNTAESLVKSIDSRPTSSKTNKGQ